MYTCIDNTERCYCMHRWAVFKYNSIYIHVCIYKCTYKYFDFYVFKYFLFLVKLMYLNTLNGEKSILLLRCYRLISNTLANVLYTVQVLIMFQHTWLEITLLYYLSIIYHSQLPLLVVAFVQGCVKVTSPF